MAFPEPSTVESIQERIVVLEARCEAAEDDREEMAAWERLQLCYAHLARLTNGVETVRAKPTHPGPLGT